MSILDISRLASTSKPATLWYHNECPANQDIHNTVRATLKGDGLVTLADPQRTLHLMRVAKSPTEVELMKETCYIGSQSMNMAMAYTKPGTYKYIHILTPHAHLGSAETAFRSSTYIRPFKIIVRLFLSYVVSIGTNLCLQGHSQRPNHAELNFLHCFIKYSIT